MNNIFEEQYENYIGSSFKTKKDKNKIYTFGPLIDGYVQICVTHTEFSMYEEYIRHDLLTVLKNIRDNIWIVID